MVATGGGAAAERRAGAAAKRRRPYRFLSAALATCGLWVFAAVVSLGRSWVTVETSRDYRGKNLRHVARQATKVIDPKDYKAAPRSAQKQYMKNPKLENLLTTREYRDFIDMFVMLKKENQLDEFVRRAKDYFSGVDLDEIQDMEDNDPKQLTKKFRRDWSKVWPGKLDNRRSESFDVFANFWARVGSTKLFDLILEAALPDIKSRGQKPSDDAELLETLSDDERSEVIKKRVLSCDIVDQYMAMAEDDLDAQSLHPKVSEFSLDIICMLEKKLSDSTERLGDITSYLFLGFLAAAITVFNFSIFQVSIPFISEPVVPTAASEAKYDTSKSSWKELEEAKQEFAERAPRTKIDSWDDMKPEVGGKLLSDLDIGFASSPRL